MSGWTARAVVRRFGEVARDEGPRALWFKVWGELCYRRLGLFELRLDGPLPSVAPRVPLEIAPLVDADLADYEQLRPGTDAGEKGPRLALGHSCFAARSDDRLVGTCWVARGSLWSSYLRTEVALAPDEALTYETYTWPEGRGKGIGAALRVHVAGLLAAEGCRRVLATVDPDNGPAIRLVEKLGYRRIGTVGYLGAGRRRRYFQRLEPGAAPPGAPG
jgi:ribosomal protein S18 acetylase RimI-like enzyme